MKKLLQIQLIVGIVITEKELKKLNNIYEGYFFLFFRQGKGFRHFLYPILCNRNVSIFFHLLSEFKQKINNSKFGTQIFNMRFFLLSDLPNKKNSFKFLLPLKEKTRVQNKSF